MRGIIVASTCLVAAAACYIVPLAAGEPVSPAKDRSALVGTWEMVHAKWNDAEDFSGPPENARALKFITPTHFIWAHYDPKTKKLHNSMGGTYTLKDGAYVETPEFAYEGMEAYVGKPQRFTVKIEGDQLTQSGVLSEGQKLVEIWKRVK